MRTELCLFISSVIIFGTQITNACLCSTLQPTGVQSFQPSGSFKDLKGRRGGLKLKRIKNPETFLTGLEKLPRSFPLELDEPTEDDELMQKERIEIGEIEKGEAAREELKQKLMNDNELHSPWDNETWLVRFLRAKRFDVKETYKLIKNYYGFKDDVKQLLEGKKPSDFVNVFARNILVAMPNRDTLGRRVLIFRASEWKTNEFSIEEVFFAAVLFAEAAVYEPKTQIAGVQVIVDFEGFDGDHLKQFTYNPLFCAKIIRYLQSSNPFKLKGLHILNQGFIFSGLYFIFHAATTKVMKERIWKHGTKIGKLIEKHNFDKSSLPDIYGGDEPIPLISADRWKEILKLCDEEYEKIHSYGVRKK